MVPRLAMLRLLLPSDGNGDFYKDVSSDFYGFENSLSSDSGSTTVLKFY
jgi:hypothetical protein